LSDLKKTAYYLAPIAVSFFGTRRKAGKRLSNCSGRFAPNLST